MNIVEENMEKYFEVCKHQKGLSEKTLKAYKIDLKQFSNYIYEKYISIDKKVITEYISYLHTQYKPKTVKRKIASIKAFFSYLEYEEMVDVSPFSKIKIRYKEPLILPKTISTLTIKKILEVAYEYGNASKTRYQQITSARNIAILELLFATGLRVSELCNLKNNNINLAEKYIKIYGKGAKERIIQIGNKNVIDAIKNYKNILKKESIYNTYFFINREGKVISEESVRNMIKKYSKTANISQNITPHMFRHTLATLLLEEDVDIRYIQHILGHSSITTTQIYTHIGSKKQREILTKHHPRNKIHLKP